MSFFIEAWLALEGDTLSDDIVIIQDLTDQIRQTYVDYNIKIPWKSEFVGDAIPLKPQVTAGHPVIERIYSRWAGVPVSLIRSSGYRNPVHNDMVGGERQSVHQYAWAEDVSPVPDYHAPRKKDDSETIRDAAYHTNATYVKLYPNNSWNQVHIQWCQYANLPNTE